MFLLSLLLYFSRLAPMIRMTNIALQTHLIIAVRQKVVAPINTTTGMAHVLVLWKVAAEEAMHAKFAI